MIQIFIANTDVDDLFATVTDKLTMPPTVPVTNQRINAGNQISTNVQEDGNGNCLVDIVTVKATDPTLFSDLNGTYGMSPKSSVK